MIILNGKQHYRQIKINREARERWFSHMSCRSGSAHEAVHEAIIPDSHDLRNQQHKGNACF